MAELKSDETKVVLIENKIEVTRTITEVFEAEEYIRRIAQLHQQVKQMQGQITDTQTVIEGFSTKEKEAEKIREDEKVAAHEERQKAFKELKTKEEPKEVEKKS